MKKVFFMAAAALILAGCDLSELMPLQDSVAEHKFTVTTPATTNIIDGVVVVTPASEQVYTQFITNKVVNPTWTHSIETVQAVNAFNPTPTAPLIALGLGALSFILGTVAKIQNSKANKVGTILNAVIDGVEKVNDPKVKEQIKLAASNYGVQADLHTAVQEQTS